MNSNTDFLWIIGAVILAISLTVSRDSNSKNSFFNKRATVKEAAFIAPPNPFLKNDSETQKRKISRKISEAQNQVEDLEDQVQNIIEQQNASPLINKIVLTQGKYGVLADSEYLRIRSPKTNGDRIKITGWSLRNKTTNSTYQLGRGAQIPHGSFYQQDIYLTPGDFAYISTGKSPIGTSFRLNACTGYLEQFQNFTPTLPTNCPYISEEILPSYIEDDSACMNYLRTIPQCEMNTSSLPNTLSVSCTSFINSEVNFYSCINRNKDEAEFFSNEWRVFLGQNQSIWEKGDIVELLDEQGKIVSRITLY